MAKEIKYTSDGKKVIVVGKLNAQETIVQEIFISNDNEIPSGENFVVKSLHDAPAISWKEKEIKQWEERYNKEKKYYEQQIEQNKNIYQGQIDAIKLKTDYLKKTVNNISAESFDMATSFLTGEIKYVIEGDNTSVILDYADFRCDYDKNKLKLLCLFGSDDGTLNWRLGYYSDGSGGGKDCYFFKTFEDAVSKLKEIFMAKNDYSESIINAAKKYNIELNADKVKAYKDRAIGSLENQIQKGAETQRKWEEEKIRINNL